MCWGTRKYCVCTLAFTAYVKLYLIMNDLTIFYSTLATVGAIVILGFFLGRSKWISEATNKQLINILLMIVMPCALFIAFPNEFDRGALNLFLAGLWGGLLVFIVLIAMSRLFFSKVTLKKAKVCSRYESQFALMFNNATFLGFPLILMLFGPEALMPYCGFIIVFNLALFSYGVFLVQGKFDKQLLLNTLINPNIVAVVLGLIFFLLSWQLPGPLNNGVSHVAAIMTPLSLICIGFMLSRANFKELLGKKRLFVTAALQLTTVPLATWLVLYLIGVPVEVRNILVLIQALPTATSLGLFAEKYGSECGSTEASELVVISTLMSAVTLPIMLGLLIY